MGTPPIHEATLSSLLDPIYATGLDPQAWIDAVEQIRIAFGASFGAIASASYGTNPRAGWIRSRQLGLEDLQAYSRLVPHSPWFGNWERSGRPVGFVVQPPILPETPIYQDYLKQRDIGPTLVAVLSSSRDPASPVLGLTLSQRPGKTFTRTQERLLAGLVPHLIRALRMNRTFAEMEQTQVTHLTVLDRVPTPTILLARDQAVVYMNPAAESLVRRADGLTVSRKRLGAADPLDQVRLTRLIESVLAGALDRTHRSVRIRRPVPRPAYEVSAYPVGQASRLAAEGNDPAVMVTLRDPDSRISVDPGTLSTRFRLTPGEAQVLVTLMGGASRKEIGTLNGISERTVRMHLSNLFRKTGTRGQTELVRAALAGIRTKHP